MSCRSSCGKKSATPSAPCSLAQNTVTKRWNAAGDIMLHVNFAFLLTRERAICHHWLSSASYANKMNDTGRTLNVSAFDESPTVTFACSVFIARLTSTPSPHDFVMKLIFFRQLRTGEAGSVERP